MSNADDCCDCEPQTKPWEVHPTLGAGFIWYRKDSRRCVWTAELSQKWRAYVRATHRWEESQPKEPLT